MRSYWNRVGPKSNMTHVLRRGEIKIHRDTERESCDVGGRDYSDVSISHRLPANTRSQKRQEGFSPIGFRKSMALPTP